MKTKKDAYADELRGKCRDAYVPLPGLFSPRSIHEGVMDCLEPLILEIAAIRSQQDALMDMT